MEIKCPNCGETFGVEAKAVIPKEQEFYMKLTANTELFSAKTIGEAIVNMEKLQRAVAADIGAKVCVLLKSVETKPHEVTIGFTILNAS